MSSLSHTPTWRADFPQVPRRSSDSEQTVEFVGTLYGVNLHTHTFRIEEQFGRRVLVTVREDADDRALARSLLGETVRVRAVHADGEGKGSDQLVAIAVERVEPPGTSNYYTWNLEKALEGKEPLRSIRDLAIPGLGGDEFEAFWKAINE